MIPLFLIPPSSLPGFRFPSPCLSALGLALLQHLLDDLLLFDEKCPDDALLDAVAAPRAAVRALHCLLGVRDLGVFTGSQSRDLVNYQYR